MATETFAGALAGTIFAVADLTAADVTGACFAATFGTGALDFAGAGFGGGWVLLIWAFFADESLPAPDFDALGFSLAPDLAFAFFTSLATGASLLSAGA